MTKLAQSEKTESDQNRVEGEASRQWASPGVIPRAAIPAELFRGGLSVSVGIRLPGSGGQRTSE